MKSQILKHTGLTEKQFYAKYKTQKDFENSKEGKSFKKAQMGAEIDKAQFGGYYNMGQTPNFQTPNAAAGFMPKNSFSIQTPKLNLFDPQGDQSQTKMAQGIFGGAHSVADSPFESKESGPGAQQIIGAFTGIADAFGAIGEQKGKLAKTRQAKGVADVTLASLESVDRDIPRQRSEQLAQNYNNVMQATTGEDRANVFGSGTNILSGRNGVRLKDGGPVGGNPTWTQNTYDPYDIYTDSGYEPEVKLKQYAQGGQFSSFMDAGGTDFTNKAIGGAFNNNAGYQMGSAVGNAAKMIPGVGPVLGAVAAPILGAAGGLADNLFGSAGKIKTEQRGLDRSIAGIKNAGSAKQTTGFLQNIGVGKDGINVHNYEEGGWVSHDWQPQVIASFGEHKLKDLLSPPHDADMLRAGGHLRDYTPPSDRAMEIYKNGGEVRRSALNGEVQTTWGGGIKTLSHNPYMPGTGETIQFVGNSHDTYDPKSKQTGIGVKYGQGNQDSYTDYAEYGTEQADANVEVEKEPAAELIDPATGEKNLTIWGNLKIPNQYIPMLGDNKAKGKKFKNYVADLSKIESKQNTLIDKSTKELNALDPKNSFDKLKLTALQANIQGANMKLKEIADKKINAASLQNAINDTAEERGLVADDLARGKVKIDKKAQKQSAKFGGKFTQAQSGITTPTNEELIKQADMKGGELDEIVIKGKPKRFMKPQLPTDIEMPEHIENPYYKDDIRSLSPEVLRGLEEKNINSGEEASKKSDWWDKAALFANTILPTIRPSDAEGLDASQLYPEMYAMATNQVSPVQTQTFQPTPKIYSETNRQAVKNDLIAQTRAAQRQVGYNPAMQAAIAAQAYNPMQQLNEADFITNQAARDRIYNENASMFDQAKQVNFERFDNQYKRQMEALANTKATTLAALSSIADKYAKNKLENRQLGIMENMYNYRFDNKGRAINMNPLQQFNIARNESSGKGESAPEGYEYETILKKKKKGEAKNGSIVKSYKNI